MKLKKLGKGFHFSSLLLLGFMTMAHGDENSLGGRVQAKIGNETVQFPILKTDIDADIQGDLITVTLKQEFANPLDQAVHAEYLFPLNKDGAVFEMEMRVADEVVRAQIKPVEQAKKTFEKAKSQGKSATLLRQHRPNMFTQNIANLTPGYPITVTLKYVQTINKVDGLYELVVPLVVGPRYQPPGAGVAPTNELQETLDDELSLSTNDTVDQQTEVSSQATFGKWELEALPAYPPTHGVNLPEHIDPDRVSIQISLNGGMPITLAESPTHTLVTDARSESSWKIKLANGRIIDNQDFVFRYQLAGEKTQAGLLSYRDERGGFLSLMLEPPKVPIESEISQREMVFVLDSSGSMNGLPMDASKAFMRKALHNLRPTDTFRIVRFSDSATEFSTHPLIATAENIQKGIHYTDQLRGSGGTEMSSGIRQALDVPVPENTIRLVTFLTDGYIGNEVTILKMIRERVGDARLFAFGVGTAVNRYLLSEMGRMGRGFTRYMDPTESVEEVAHELAQRLQSPVLTDIEIDWGELEVTETYPRQIPDLFAGQTVRVQGRFAKAGNYNIKVNGHVNGRKASLPLQLSLQAKSHEGEAIALIWARSAIKDTMRELATSSVSASSLDSIKQKVINLGLKFSLVTRWTAFVAVSEKIYNTDAENSKTVSVPLQKVKGVSKLAYGQSGSQFSGGSTPEPGFIASLLVIMLLSGLFISRRGNRNHLSL
ncbi:MAG: VIT and VWA domain-containing protein [Gammaproteobacteria bacterium]|nr:VIT and VWA domain-containing protein [Gammaproteobacteria bacterium]